MLTDSSSSLVYSTQYMKLAKKFLMVIGLAFVDCSASSKTVEVLNQVADLGCCVVLANKKPLTASLVCIHFMSSDKWIWKTKQVEFAICWSFNTVIAFRLLSYSISPLHWREVKVCPIVQSSNSIVCLNFINSLFAGSLWQAGVTPSSHQARVNCKYNLILNVNWVYFIEWTSWYKFQQLFKSVRSSQENSSWIFFFFLSGERIEVRIWHVYELSLMGNSTAN